MDDAAPAQPDTATLIVPIGASQWATVTLQINGQPGPGVATFDPADVAALVRTIDPLLVRELMERRQLPVTADQYAATIDIIAGLIEQATGQ